MFLSVREEDDHDYEAWAFDCAPDKLAQLVQQGIKQATASFYDGEDQLPKVGTISIILSSTGEPVCAIRTQSITILPFSKVTKEMAKIEGEGDGSLKYWRKVHRIYFQEEAEKRGLQFRENMRIVFETFELCEPKN
ncbi:MAG: ASCH domain-containing protein [Candidatus Izemoplasmatales bacterium]|nr:ASCH domain-containing protein [Candidatus Izemoplasmatales bacterium]